MNQKLFLKLFFGVLFFSISVYNLWFYIEGQRIINNNIPIQYTYIDREIKTWRGTSYLMEVMYKRDHFTVYLTKEEYEKIENNKFPKLYFSEKQKKVFSEWDVDVAYRIILLFGIGFMVVIAPLDKIARYIVQKVDKKRSDL